MSKVSVKLEYDRKVAELQERVAKEAKNLQSVLNEKEAITKQVYCLIERKQFLNEQIHNLEINLKGKEDSINEIIKKESEFLSSIKEEQKKEANILKEIKKELSELEIYLSEKKNVISELNEFIKKERDVRERFIIEDEKLQNSLTISKQITKEVGEKLESLEIKNRDVDSLKQYVADLYGKMASYVRVMNETIEYVNEFLNKNKIPLEFELPAEEKIKISFDNFNEKPKDT
jgi:chromosome segregation ATPase